MIESSLSQATAIMRGTLHGTDAAFRGIGTDSRTLGAGELFFALQGPNFDGHEFVPQAAASRAAGAVLSRKLDVALPNNSAGQPNLNAVTSAFYFNVGDNSTALNTGYPTFGRVTYGLANLDSMLNTPRFTGRESPIRPPLVKRMRRVEGFPVLDIHTGAWFDPAKSCRGFNVEVGKAAGSEEGPLIVVYWYDYFEGRQVWMNGAAEFAWGDHEITIPMQITSGGQFGAAFDPATVQTNANWGTLTVTFTGCDRATFSYTSAFGNGSVNLEKLTLPNTQRCNGN